MRLAPLLVAAALSFCFGDVGAKAEPPVKSAPLPLASLPFLIDLPVGFEVRSRQMGLDSVVYDVVKDGVVNVGVTVGPDPAFPIVDDEDVRVVKRSDRLFVAIRGEGKDAYVGEYLWTGKAGQEIHVWGLYGENIDSKVVWAIMASVKPRP